MRAFTAGAELARVSGFGVNADWRALLAGLGLEVVRWPLRGRLREIIVDGVIAIDSGQPGPWARWLTAHAVGHHALHTGTSFYLDTWQWVNRVKPEREAEEFAAGLLMPAGAAPGLGPDAMAQRLGLPPVKVRAAWPLWCKAGYVS